MTERVIKKVQNFHLQKDCLLSTKHFAILRPIRLIQSLCGMEYSVENSFDIDLSEAEKYQSFHESCIFFITLFQTLYVSQNCIMRTFFAVHNMN